MSQNDRRSVIVYRDSLLAPSETFIRAQAESLTRFSPIFTCLRRRPGLDLPQERVLELCGRGFAGLVRFKLLGPAKDQTRMLAGLEPALVHAHFAPNGCDVIKLARGLGVPLLVSLHGYGINSSDTRLSKLYTHRRERLWSEAARFLCISEFIRNRAVAKGFPPEKCVVHYTGVDCDFFTPAKTIAREPIVLFVGRLVEGKGCTYLVRAMAEVQRSAPEMRLVVIGDGPELEKLRAQAKHSLKQFTFLGAQPPAEVKNWMNRASVFSCPSIATPTSHEGFGMAFIEAQAMGLPVVSTNIGGIPEAVADGHTGFLVPERDSEALAEKLLTLLHNGELRAACGAAGRARTGRLFNLRQQAICLQKIYDDVLAERLANSAFAPTVQ